MSSQNYYFCPLCVERKPYYSFRELFRHIQYIHNKELNFKIRCELGRYCGTIYSTFAAYKAHIYRDHAILLNTTLSEEVTMNPKVYDKEVSLLETNDTQLNFDTPARNVEDEKCCTDTESEDEDVISWPLLTEKVAQTTEKEINLDLFEKFYIDFLLNLREAHYLPQNVIESITNGCKMLIQFIHELLKIQIKNSSTKHAKTVNNTPIDHSLLLNNVNQVISTVLERITNIAKNEYNFLKLCKKYFSYSPAKPIHLNSSDQVAYYIPIQSNIQQMLNKPDILTMLTSNFNENINRNAKDADIMFNYRHGLGAKQHPILRTKPDALLFQLYIDEIGLTNPIGAKKDTQKITMIYYQLEDLPDTIKSMLNSIGVIAMCRSTYLNDKVNRKKFFDPIVQDLNVLQTDGVFIPHLGRHLFFAFTILAGDHLACNDIGGFQKIFSTGEFCRHCHINYNQRLVVLNETSHLLRTTDQHDNIVAQLTNSGDNILNGVVGASPLADLIGFHAVSGLPNDPMHDFNEGVCGLLIMGTFKELSSKRLLTYEEIENRLASFKYGENDKSNKPPILRKKHFTKGKIIGTASQKMLLFKLLPIIFCDVFNRLEIKEVYICFREIISLVFAYPFRKSWLAYLQSLTIRFQCLMVHLLPHLVVPKVHFVTHYARQIAMNGPAIRHWCMRFEAKHQVFKQLAVKSNNFKNILYTLSKRNQLRQCLFLSSSNHFSIVNSGCSLSEREFHTIPIDIREDIDGETLFNLPQSMMYEIIKSIKERVRFLTEHRDLFNGIIRSVSDKPIDETDTQNLLTIGSQQVIQQHDFNQVSTQSIVPVANDHQDGDLEFASSINLNVTNEEVIDISNGDENKENDDGEDLTFPYTYILPELPPKLQQIIQNGEINEFRGHTNVRRLLLDVVFTDVTTKYSLLYPDKSQYRSIAKGIINTLKIHKDNETLNDWIESIKSKFKRERRPLQQKSEQVLKMKVKYGNGTGRPIKRSDVAIAPRRTSTVQFWNLIDVHDDPEEMKKYIELMTNELTNQNIDFNIIRRLWRKTLVERRTFIQNHTTKEVLEEYPGYSNTSLIFDEIQYVCDIDIQENLQSMLPELLDILPFNSGFVNDLPSVRLIKLLSTYFTDSWQQILSDKEPSSPRPYIQMTTEKFIIFLDYEIITETTSIDQAICVIISLYVIFDLHFGLHNRTIQLLYAILLQEPGALTKPLRVLLCQWNFVINKKQNKGCIRMTTNALPIDNMHTNSYEKSNRVEDNQSIYMCDREQEENRVENETGLQHSENVDQSDLSAIMTSEGTANQPIINSSTTSSSSSLSSSLLSSTSSSPASVASSSSLPASATSPSSLSSSTAAAAASLSTLSSSLSTIDQLVVIPVTPVEKQQVLISSSTAPTERASFTKNIKQKTSTKSNDLSSTVSKNSVEQKRKSDSEESIAQRLKRSRNRRKY